jgi:hypothetical protein
MDRVLVFVTAVGVLAVAAVALARLLLPWPQRVRWTVMAQAMGHGGPGHTAYPRLDLREVVLVSVEARAGGLEVRVLEVGRPAHDTLTFTGATTDAAELLSMLQDWCAIRTPMLLYLDAAGVASLSGPVATITNLRSVSTPDVSDLSSTSRR